MRGANKPNVIANIKDTIKRTEEQTSKDPIGNAWMVPFREDLYSLLAEADKLSGAEMDQKLREILTKHQP
jgi:hypothetical protein